MKGLGEAGGAGGTIPGLPMLECSHFQVLSSPLSELIRGSRIFGGRRTEDPQFFGGGIPLVVIPAWFLWSSKGSSLPASP